MRVGRLLLPSSIMNNVEKLGSSLKAASHSPHIRQLLDFEAMLLVMPPSAFS